MNDSLLVYFDTLPYPDSSLPISSVVDAPSSSLVISQVNVSARDGSILNGESIIQPINVRCTSTPTPYASAYGSVNRDPYSSGIGPSIQSSFSMNSIKFKTNSHNILILYII